MMERLLLDTDAIIDYLKGFPATVSLLQQRHQSGDSLCVSDVVIAEVYAGLRPNDRPQAETFLNACTFLPTSADAAKQAGEWRYGYARRGITIAITDTRVAATAYSNRAKLVTGNTADYPMPEVSLVPLPRPGSPTKR
jgi:tRNA(fMet)-specific endonuclease VapC